MPHFPRLIISGSTGFGGASIEPTKGVPASTNGRPRRNFMTVFLHDDIDVTIFGHCEEIIFLRDSWNRPDADPRRAAGRMRRRRRGGPRRHGGGIEIGRPRGGTPTQHHIEPNPDSAAPPFPTDADPCLGCPADDGVPARLRAERERRTDNPFRTRDAIEPEIGVDGDYPYGGGVPPPPGAVCGACPQRRRRNRSRCRRSRQRAGRGNRRAWFYRGVSLTGAAQRVVSPALHAATSASHFMRSSADIAATRAFSAS